MTLLPYVPGLLVLAAVVVLSVYATRSAGVHWVLLSLLIYAASLGRYQAPWFDERLAFPLEEIRTYRLGIIAATLALLVAPAVAFACTARPPVRLNARFAFLVFQAVFALRLTVDNPGRGLPALLTDLTMFLVFGVVLPWRLRSTADVHGLLQGVAVAGVWFALAAGYQTLFDVSAMQWVGRFFGTTENAQHAATLLAGVALPTVYLMLSPREPRRRRMAWATSVGVLSVLLLWTGSRTGLIMLSCGLLVLTRRQLTRLLPVVAVGVACCVLVLYATPELRTAFGRLGSTKNTRAAPFQRMSETFLESPWFGAGDQAIAESSYLATASATGLLGVAMLAIVILQTGLELRQLIRNRRSLGDHQDFVDLALAGFVMLAVGAFAEAYLLGVLSPPVLLLNVYYALIAFLRERLLAACPPHRAAAAPHGASWNATA